MSIDSFIVHVKTDDNYRYIAEDIETKPDNSIFELYKLLPKGENKNMEKSWKNLSD